MVTDKIGTEIQPGSIITYGVQSGYSVTLRIGKVLKVKETPASFGDGRNYRIKVHSIGDHYRYNKDEPLKLLGKPTTLQYPDRILVIPEYLLSSEVKALLDTVSVV